MTLSTSKVDGGHPIFSQPTPLSQPMGSRLPVTDDNTVATSAEFLWSCKRNLCFSITGETVAVINMMTIEATIINPMFQFDG